MATRAGPPYKELPGIEALIAAGMTATKIAALLGTSSHTVNAWARRNGLTIALGSGRHNGSQIERDRRPKTKVNPPAEQTYGCSSEQAIALNGGAPLNSGMAVRYKEQRSAAAKRGIAWDFTFASWIAVWVDSGKWPLRGCRRGEYVMARNGDIGPYSADNVSIVTCTENVKQVVRRITRNPLGRIQPAGQAA